MNAALLGTDRRAVPRRAGTDPADWLLEAAGRRRAATLVARRVDRRPARARRPGRPAPGAAGRRPARCSTRSSCRPRPRVLDLWLREALAAGVGLAPERWAPVLDRARRATGLDRGRLGAALGPRGLWFARHNPAWSAVVRAAEAHRGAVDDADPDADAPAGARTERLLTWPAPSAAPPAWPSACWPPGSTSVARGARTFGQHVGARLPLAAYAGLTSIAASRLDPAATAAARAGLAAAEEVLWVRWACAQRLRPDPGAPERRPSHRPHPARSAVTEAIIEQAHGAGGGAGGAAAARGGRLRRGARRAGGVRRGGGPAAPAALAAVAVGGRHLPRRRRRWRTARWSAPSTSGRAG